MPNVINNLENTNLQKKKKHNQIPFVNDRVKKIKIMQISMAFLDHNLVSYVKSLAPNNSLGNHPNNIFANENEYLCTRMFKTVVTKRKLFKQIMEDL